MAKAQPKKAAVRTKRRERKNIERARFISVRPLTTPS